MFVITLYSVTPHCMFMVFIAFIFCADTLLPGAPQQLPPTASSPSEAFTAGMCGVPNGAVYL